VAEERVLPWTPRNLGCALMAKEKNEFDKSVWADARRLRWLLSGNGYFLEEAQLCGCGPCSQDEQDVARLAIDEEMAYEER